MVNVAPPRHETSDCYLKAIPGEPRFTLLARDPSAPIAIHAWVKERRTHLIKNSDNIDPKEEKEEFRKLQEADEIANEMIEWRMENEGKWRIPTEEEGRHYHGNGN